MKGFTIVGKCPFSPQVLDPTEATGGPVDTLHATVENVVIQLKKQGLLSGGTVGQIFSSVSNKLNGQTDPLKKVERQKVNGPRGCGCYWNRCRDGFRK